jgi:UTP-glucose-1-phosphate uridylyltransferase
VERTVGGDPIDVLLTDDVLTNYDPGVTANLAQTYMSSGKSQLLVIEIQEPEYQNTVLLCQTIIAQVLRVCLKNLT